MLSILRKKNVSYPAILTAFKINIRALSNSRFTTHALAACRSTSIAILCKIKTDTE